MTTTLAQSLDKLLLSYSQLFDVRRDTVSGGYGFSAEADFNSRSERYALVKSATLWAAETYEYVFISAQDQLDLAGYQAVKQAALETGLSRIRPHKEHMYTYVTLCLLVEELSPEVRQAIKHSRFHKNFKLSLHGWMDFRVIAKELSTGTLTYNRAGKPLGALLRDKSKYRHRPERHHSLHCHRHEFRPEHQPGHLDGHPGYLHPHRLCHPCLGAVTAP